MKSVFRISLHVREHEEENIQAENRLTLVWKRELPCMELILWSSY